MGSFAELQQNVSQRLKIIVGIVRENRTSADHVVLVQFCLLLFTDPRQSDIDLPTIRFIRRSCNKTVLLKLVDSQGCGRFCQTHRLCNFPHRYWARLKAVEDTKFGRRQPSFARIANSPCQAPRHGEDELGQREIPDRPRRFRFTHN
jgi:hypothetical protein